MSVKKHQGSGRMRPRNANVITVIHSMKSSGLFIPTERYINNEIKICLVSYVNFHETYMIAHSLENDEIGTIGKVYVSTFQGHQPFDHTYHIE